MLPCAVPLSRVELARYLRRTMSGVEWDLWSCLRGKRLDGFKFRRKALVGPYIGDFACFSARLVVELRVLGRQRTVKVRAEDGPLEAAFGVILAVVAEAHAHAAERPSFRPQVRTPAVILEADQGLWVEIGQVGVDDHVADESALAGLGAHVDEAEAGEPLAVAGLVVVAK